MLKIGFRTFLAVFTSLALVLSQLAYAVVSNINIVGSSGEPLPNATVLIVFPDGVTEVEEESDDDGILYFEFPGDGNYHLTWAGGEMMFNPAAAAAGSSTGAIMGVTAAAIAIGAAASGGSSGSNTSPPVVADPPVSDPPPMTDPPVTDPPVTDPPVEDPNEPPPMEEPPMDDFSGMYDTDSREGQNSCSHPPWASSFLMDVNCSGGSCLATSPDNDQFIDCSGSVSNGAWSCSGFGSFQGFSTDQMCEGEFFSNGSTILFSGSCFTGNDGALPGNCPIEHRLEGTRQ